MAERGVAWTFLDVKFPQIICKGCGNEFEYLQENCTHPSVSFSPPTTKGKGKGKSLPYKKGHDKGLSKGYYGKGYGSDKGKGKGKAKGFAYDTSEETKTAGPMVDHLDVIAILKQYGAGILSDEQSNLINSKLCTHAEQLRDFGGIAYKAKDKSEVQIAKNKYKAAQSELSAYGNTLKQSKHSLANLDSKFKSLLITICEQTQAYTQMKADTDTLKAEFERLASEQDDKLDISIQQIALDHSRAVEAIKVSEADLDHSHDDDDEHAGDEADGETVYKAANVGGDPADKPTSDDADMTQAAQKRHLPTLNLNSDSSSEEILTAFKTLNGAKKSKSTPRGSDDGYSDAVPSLTAGSGTGDSVEGH